MSTHDPKRGLNLGGWLVIEKWMTPSLFEGTTARNEFELARTQQGRERIAHHHTTFITKKDLIWMKRNGVRILRVPVGYWIFGQDLRYVGAIDRLDWLMSTSLSLGLEVLLDLHAAPGAQNRAAHSGSGNTVRTKHSIKWLNDTSAQDETIAVLCQLAERYRHFPHVWGIQMLNEPTVDWFGLKLARFYRRAYTALTKVARPGTRIVFSDGYAPLRLTNCLWLQARRTHPVVMDCHIYQVFGSADRRRSYEGSLRRLRWVRLLLRIFRLQQHVIIGEWSAMLPRRVGQTASQRYVTAQHRAFEPALAHMYWSYKTESEGRWNYQDMCGKGLIQ